MVALLKENNPLRIGGSDNDSANRRMFARKENHTRIEGRRVDHTVEAQRDPHLSLSLRDVSLGGLSAISHAPLERGEKLAVFFPPQGAQRGWDACGRVIRCEPSGFGYRVALQFDPILAAA